MKQRLTFKEWSFDFFCRVLPVVVGIAITFTLQGIVNRAHDRKAVRSAMELVRTELTANLQDIAQLTDYMKQEQISAKYLADHKDDLESCPKDIVNFHLGQVNADVSLVLSQNALELLKMSSLFPKVENNPLSMEIIRAYDACTLLESDVNRHYANRKGGSTPWLFNHNMAEYTSDIEQALGAIDLFLGK